VAKRRAVDLLRLMFVACHPVLSTEAQVALTLRLLGGLTTDEIARAFLVPEPTVAKRIVRAKRYSATAGDDWMRPELCGEALRLGRILAGLVPGEPEVHGLVALMEIQAPR
jgi:predicted RNA polymerase sigma factor